MLPYFRLFLQCSGEGVPIMRSGECESTFAELSLRRPTWLLVTTMFAQRRRDLKPNAAYELLIWPNYGSCFLESDRIYTVSHSSVLSGRQTVTDGMTDPVAVDADSDRREDGRGDADGL